MFERLSEWESQALLGLTAVSWCCSRKHGWTCWCLLAASLCVSVCVCVSLHHFFSDWVLVHSCLTTHPLFPSCPHTTHLLLNFITLNSGSEPCLSNSNYPSRMMHLLCCRHCHGSFRVAFSIKTL